MPRGRFDGKVVRVENLDRVMKGLNEFQRKDVGEATAKAFGRTAKKGVIAGKRELRRGLTNRSKYITSGVKGQPITPNQKKSFSRSFSRNFIADGSVYIRGANSKRRELDFLMDHEYGKKRVAAHTTMSIPLKGLRDWKGRDWRSTRGATKKTMKPKKLLGSSYAEEMNKIKSGKSYLVVYKGKTKSKRQGGKGRKHNNKPFVMTRKRKNITSKKSRFRGKLIYLYKFQKVTKQTDKIQWGDVVETSIKANLRNDINRQLRKVIPKTYT